ncbi:MAG: LysE family translocator [Anaerolineales bacterium]|nr:LysE family translocator [Anaerolineales bacterium]MCW5854967.1 LysE family translocator [Anaerolineales bacterium]
MFNWLPTITYALVANFTPGPNNITSAAMGVLYGYRRSLPFLLGCAAGFYLVLLAAALVSATLLTAIPGIEPVLRYVGSLYILYLAYSILKTTYKFEDDQAQPMGFVQGFLFQIVNPKVLIYALTLFSTFLAGFTKDIPFLLLILIPLTFSCFAAISTWTLFGTLIKKYLAFPRIRLAVNVVLALMLVYSAADMVGLV